MQSVLPPVASAREKKGSNRRSGKAFHMRKTGAAQFSAIFVGLKLQLQNRACKPAATDFIAIVAQFISAV